ncbi:hypothetical protein [Leeuwenhoekiella nanhaiensis]|uniref:Uncharacterized protein n=1 Tax=Leeuwenhoekiella nanhaiensis TaxID=1655491 RepID=A0A2G1VPI8_9FLAO|nr:hypothetical protein [Leeuwenhoekiella nanhaiensis]PHQ28389.1 hypothetical protein CJ305_14825 [Leeuwenhoekiella nanhaiensis]
MQKTFYLLIALVIFGNALCFSQVREGSKERLEQAVDYVYTENYKEALALLKTLLELSTPQEQETVFFTQVLSEWIKVYTALNNSQAALPALKKAQNYVKEHLRDQYLLLARYKNLEEEVWMGSISAKSLQLAVSYFKEAEALIVKSNFKDPELNQHIMINIVNTDTRLGDYDNAENYIQKAFDQVQAQNGTPLDIVPFALPYVRILELKNMYAEALEMLITIRSILDSNRTHSYYNSYFLQY